MIGNEIPYQWSAEAKDSQWTCTQMVGEKAASSNSEGECESDNEGKKRMEPNEGVLR